MTCIGACLARNEEDRYLERAIKNAQQFCDAVLVIDDHSTDHTAGLAASIGAHIVSLDGVSPVSGWWGKDEVPARHMLWMQATEMAGREGWIYFFDADHELLGITPTEFRKLLTSRVVNSWACVLWDCWDSDQTHRVDGYWQAWNTPRVWVVRAQPSDIFIPSWPDRQHHVGHIPANYPYRPGLMPPGAGIRHLGYVKPYDRLMKRRRYLDLKEDEC
jgi:hypothetical protein